jgi:hypothetical protein
MDEEEIPPFTQPEDETEALKAAFARRGEELQQALKRGRQWIGVVDTLPERLAALYAEAAMVQSEPVTAVMNGHGVVDAELLEVTQDVPAEVISQPMEEVSAASVLDLLSVGNDEKSGSSLPDSSKVTTDRAGLAPISVSSASVNGTNGTNGHGTRPTWETLLHILEEEKARKSSSRSRKKEPEKATTATHVTNLWEIQTEGDELCNTTLDMTKAEELMPETTQVSQATLW